MKSILSIVCCFFSVIFIAQKHKQLKFDNKGEFKILQLTDTHWSCNNRYTATTKKTIQSLIEKENPDFIVLTGDNVNCEQMKKGWEDLANIFEEKKKYWTLVFGNHDEEYDWSKTQSYEFLKSFPHFIGEKGNVSGVINYSLPIYSNDNQDISSVLYFLDSGDYTKNPLLGSYDWIKSDQVQWYIEESNSYTQKTGKKIPSLMFFHIPLPEYDFIKNNAATIGDKDDDVSSSEINSGMLASILEQKDVMAVFVGHDHDNSYIGTYKGVALGYGSKTGNDGYGKLEHGGRIIILKEKKFAFRTYITTTSQIKFQYAYPVGLPEINQEIKVSESLNVIPKNRGLNYRYFEGKVKSVKQIESLNLIKKGVLRRMDLSPQQSNDHFAIIYDGYLKVPETAYYKFYTYSDDGSVLKINDKVVVDNDGGHSARRKEGIVALEKGFHKIQLLYFEDYMGQILEVGFSSINIPEKILEEELFHN